MITGNAVAGDADVTDVTVDCSDSLCRFHVTVQHDDAGWDHYANGIIVLSENDEVLGNRPLRHPHVGQPSFTRTLQTLIPTEIKRVTVKVHDSIHGFSGQSRIVELPDR